MKKIYTLLIFVMCVFNCACSDSDDDVAAKNGVVGNWYYTEDGMIYAVELNKDGTGTMTIHTWSSLPTLTGGYKNGWKEESVNLQYTFVENLLTAKLMNDNEVIIAVVGITGNSMSLTGSDFAIMLTRYDGSERKINELKKEYEDNLEELISKPMNECWVDENYIQNAIYSIYSSLIDYEYKQMLLEKIRLTQKDFDGHWIPTIAPSDSKVSDAWSAGYRTISFTNMVINKLETMDGSYIEEYKRTACINEAKALRCMVYYNLSQLWGNIPYITIPNDLDNYDEIQQSPIYSTQTLCSELDGILQSIDHLPEGEGRITMETVKALRAEIILSLGYKEEAGYLLRDCQSDFYIIIEEDYNPEIYRIFGERIPNYTSEKTALLLKEIHVESSADKSALAAGWETQKQDWGYWLMLKRTGQAQTVSGCKEYELLMPIPQSEIEMLSLLQNPGY